MHNSILMPMAFQSARELHQSCITSRVSVSPLYVLGTCLYIQVTVMRCKNAVRAKRPPMWYREPVYTSNVLL